MGKLHGQVILITGATSGMGKAMASLFASEGAKLVISGRNKSKGKDLQKELISLGFDVFFYAGDISLPETNKKLVDIALNQYGKIDTFVANAGILGLGKVTDLSISDWHKTLNANLSALFYLSKFAIPHMLKNDSGIILANASIAAFKSFPEHPAYCASKAGQLSLIKQIALDYGPKIRANAICPGPIDTPLIWDSARAFENPEKAVDQAAKATLLGRLGTPEEVAKLALFLISKESSFISGSSFNIDGGILNR